VRCHLRKTPTRRFLFMAVLALAAMPRATAQSPDPEPSRSDLDAVTSRGRQIAVLDSFGASATDALRSQGNEWPAGGLYICSRESAGLQCAIGTLDASPERFALSYLVVEDRDEGDLNVLHFQEPKMKQGWLVKAATAIPRGTSRVRPTG